MTRTASELSKPLKDLKKAGIWEGTSYLLLLFIAMPLKYFADFPLAVRIMGTVHGILFILFLYAIYNAMSNGGLGIVKAIIAFIASLIPFGTYFLDRLVLNSKE